MSEPNLISRILILRFALFLVLRLTMAPAKLVSDVCYGSCAALYSNVSLV